jgi:hypothetical protein
MESDMEIPKAEAPVAQWTRIEYGVKDMREKLIEMGQRVHIVETSTSAHAIDILKLQLSEKSRESLEAGITAALERQANQRWSPFARLMTVIASMTSVVTIVVLLAKTRH